MLAFAAILPAAKRTTDKNTAAALQTIEADLYAAKVERVIFLSSAASGTTAFSVNTSPQVTGDGKTYKGDVELAYHLQEARPEGYTVGLEQSAQLPADASYPLARILGHLPNARVVTIACAKTDLETHASFGDLLRKKIHEDRKRIALLAASPASADKAITEKIRELIRQKDEYGLLQASHKKPLLSIQNDLRAIIVLLSTLKTSNYHPVELAFDEQHGAASLVVEMQL